MMSADRESIEIALAEFGEHRNEIVRLTLKDANQFLITIAQCIEGGDQQEVILAAHSLKSILRQIGALSVASSAANIEMAGKKGDNNLCRQELLILKSQYIRLQEYLEAQ